MTVRLIDLPYRELHPTVKALSDAGFDNELAELVRKKGGGKRAVAALRREFFSQSTAGTDHIAHLPTNTPLIGTDTLAAHGGRLDFGDDSDEDGLACVRWSLGG